MNPTLKQIEQALAKNAVPAAMADVFDEIPSYQDTNRALKDLRSHHRDLGRWVNKEVEKEKERISRDRDTFLAQRQKKVNVVFDGFAAFGIEPTGSTSEDLTVAWELVAEGLDKKQRDDRLLGRSPSPDSGAGVATVDPAVAEARALRDGIDAVTDIDTRIAAVDARIEAVDPYEIDERYVKYFNEFAAKGLQNNPGESGRPVMDPDLRLRTEQHGILGETGHVGGGA